MYKKKVIHLREKYRKEEGETENVPEDLAELAKLSVDSKVKCNEIEKEQSDVKTIEDVMLSEDRKSILKHHNKFSRIENLKSGGIDIEQELSVAKLRMELEKEKNCEGRMIFDARERSLTIEREG